MKNSRVAGSEYMRERADEVRGDRRHVEPHRSSYYEDFSILLSKIELHWRVLCREVIEYDLPLKDYSGCCAGNKFRERVASRETD